MISNVNEKVSKITTIPTKVLNKLTNKYILCVADTLEESIKNNEEITEVDVGIGTIIMKQTGDEIAYKFIPSQRLEQALKETVKKGVSPLTQEIDTALVNRLTHVYKDLM